MGAALERYTKLLLGVGLKYVKDLHTAQDLVQQVFLKALEKLPTGDLNLAGWLYAVMRNECLDYLRKNDSITYTAIVELAENVDAETEAAHKHWERVFNEEQLLATLQELNGNQRRALELFYLQNKSYREIAEICSWDLGEVKTHIQNGKRNLKLKLEQKKDSE